MADNYLEKRMEELKAGKLTISTRNNASVSIANKIQFNFPPKRIIIYDAIMPEGCIIGESFKRIGCKVAFAFSGEAQIPNEYLEKIANEGFIIFSSTDYADFESKLKDIVTKWRGADILINFNSRYITNSIEIIENYLKQKPSPSDYQKRLINITDISSDTKRYHIPQYNILYSRSYGSSDSLRRMVQFLSLPEASQLPNGFTMRN